MLWMDSSLPKEEGVLTKAFTAAIAHRGGPYLDSLVSKVKCNTPPPFYLGRGHS